ncbi:MAG TPA: carbamoyl phosphate synthase small subunit [Firmicutes bacterium]|nr:carbamoyl phosphate synthase small subunit [Bacillota bacterium]
MKKTEQAAYLVLENGKVFQGKRFGAAGDVTGEIVFTTAMTGYLETLTDPSYYGQIVVQTFPLIGNYGVIPSDFESAAPALKAYIVREWCQEPSNFRSEGALGAFLESAGVVGLYGIDTRALTRIIREYGVMNARIASSKEEAVACASALGEYKVENAVRAVTCPRPVPPAGEGLRRVVLWDFGAKANIRRELEKRGCAVTTVPAGTTAEEIAGMAPDGVMLSNGPGDPAENTAIIEELRRLCGYKIPLFGICLGHQLLALAQGAKTVKLKYGHRGANQPVRDTETGRVYITSQNHGYAVVADSLPANARLSFVNANDGTSEGIAYSDMPAFSVQFHPEACGGPLDTGFLFDRFVEAVDRHKAR